jgi:hypothetical protein
MPTLIRIELACAVLVAVVGGASALACSKKICDGPPIVDGLVVYTSVPISDVTLSGPACSGARFRCVPADFDNQIHGQCDELQIEAKMEGECVVDLDLAGTMVHVEREMVKMAYCDGFVISAGKVDLRAAPDGGPDADATAPAVSAATDS